MSPLSSSFLFFFSFVSGSSLVVALSARGKYPEPAVVIISSGARASAAAGEEESEGFAAQACSVRKGLGSSLSFDRHELASSSKLAVHPAPRVPVNGGSPDDDVDRRIAWSLGVGHSGREGAGEGGEEEVVVEVADVFGAIEGDDASSLLLRLLEASAEEGSGGPSCDRATCTWPVRKSRSKRRNRASSGGEEREEEASLWLCRRRRCSEAAPFAMVSFLAAGRLSRCFSCSQSVEAVENDS